ncbi:hypothetical protein SAMN05443665_103155 [Actinomadura meyerae]|uniref:Uncharacterized protein n=1 Tax=Actinomadura meyerae TaxID=240840 RepID=A0A239MTD0_9ACTN|nr:hypothetical protein [Actinomadura meyerae]SNT45503.1 hypothetical protein SAMN05443665_103155 [Actinomadura meyerae]
MIRFLAHPRLAGLLGDWFRCTCGVLGCTAVAGAISIGAAAASQAAAHPEPGVRRSVPQVCRHTVTIGDWRKCKEAWRSMYERSRRGSGRGRDFPRWAGRHGWKPESGRKKPPSPAPLLKPSPRGGRPDPPLDESPAPDRTPPPPPTAPAREPARVRERADEVESRPPSLQPVLLLSLLIPAAAAICYPFRHRLYAVAAGLPTLGLPEEEPAPARFGHRPACDPFAAPATGLAGPGAVSTARVLALTALDEHGDDCLVVVPRPDATTLFGLAEDELLDDDTDGLFIPGNLDAALAYLETELVIRENTGVTRARRLLLVADCSQEPDRIQALLTRHPGGASAILLGPWPGDRAVIDDTGRVTAPAGLAAGLPDHVPALSRTEARDRLLAALARHKKPEKPSPKRRSSPRRP